MRLFYITILLILSICSFLSCSTEEDVMTGNIGYLCLSVSGSNETTTRAANLPEGYTGKQIAVEIVDTAGVAVEKTEDAGEWADKSIALKAGIYTIKAHSYGFDGKQSAKGAPYYYGSKEITITGGKALNETVTCKLANVKMSVKLSDELKESFKTFSVSVAPKTAGACDPLSFDIDLSKSTIADTLYFPVTDLVVTYAAVNKSGKSNSAKWNLSDVKGNYHYILNFTLGIGEGGAQVEVDETLHNFTYTFTVSQKPTNNVALTAEAWDRLAYLKAEDITVATGVSLEGIKFRYRVKPANRETETAVWTDLAAAASSDKKSYSAMLMGLSAETEYEYCLVNDEGTVLGSISSFETDEKDARTVLPNASFEDWSVHSAETAMGKQNTTFPCSELDYGTGMFWDTSNRGANSSGQIDPTQGVTSPIVSGTFAACLKSTEIMGFFAAASLYTGEFVSATMNWSSFSATALIDFGKAFTSRPISLKGYYQYKPEAVGDVDSALNGLINKGDNDQCSIYIVLAKDIHRVDNTKSSTFLTAERIKNDENFLAYGDLNDATFETALENGYIPFTIPLKYKEECFGDQPSYIIIVCSASKYGDYMTGGKGSTLYVDDFSLVYDGEPTLWK